MVKEAGVPHDALATFLLLDAAWSGVTRVFDQVLREEAASVAQALALLAIARAEQPLLMRRLADELVQEAQSITSLMDRLERAGWARRVHDLADRRAIRIELTEAGTEKVAAVRPRLEQAAIAVAATLSARQREQLGTALGSLYDCCRSQPGVRLPERMTGV